MSTMPYFRENGLYRAPPPPRPVLLPVAASVYGEDAAGPESMSARDQWNRAKSGIIPMVLKRAHGLCEVCDVPVLSVARDLKNMAEEYAEDVYADACFLATGSADSHHNWNIDHIVPLRLGGDPLDFYNLRLVCRNCHSLLTEYLEERLRKGTKPRRIIRHLKGFSLRPS